MSDSVNHPQHYTPGDYETYKVIQDWGLGFFLGNALKYISRAGKKDPTKTIEDLKKAEWYLQRVCEGSYSEHVVTSRTMNLLPAEAARVWALDSRPSMVVGLIHDAVYGSWSYCTTTALMFLRTHIAKLEGNA